MTKRIQQSTRPRIIEEELNVLENITQNPNRILKDKLDAIEKEGISTKIPLAKLFSLVLPF